jgi:carbamoyl-phosphate synthase small subunit
MTGYLSLENGTVFKGELGHGSKGPVEGEIVFFTGMTGYQEVLLPIRIKSLYSPIR